MGETQALWKFFVFLLSSHHLINERLGPWSGGVHALSGLLEQVWILWLGCNGFQPGSNTSLLCDLNRSLNSSMHQLPYLKEG